MQRARAPRHTVPVSNRPGRRPRPRLVRSPTTTHRRLRLVAATLYALCAVAFAAASISTAIDAADLRRQGVTTTATITEYTYGGRFGTFVNGYVIRYTPDDANTALTGELPADGGTLPLGAHLPVLYNPAEPGDVVSAEAGPDDTATWITAALAAAAAICATVTAAGRLPRLWGGTLIPDSAPTHTR